MQNSAVTAGSAAEAARSWGIRSVTEDPTISNGGDSCQHDCPFLLDQQALLPYNGNEPMRLRRLAALLLFTTAGLSVLFAAGPHMSVADIRPGMVGIGR